MREIILVLYVIIQPLNEAAGADYKRINILGGSFSNDSGWRDFDLEISNDVEGAGLRIVLFRNSEQITPNKDAKIYLSNIKVEYNDSTKTHEDGLVFLPMEVSNGILQVKNADGVIVSEDNLPNIKRITYGHGVLNEESGIYWFRSYRSTIPYLRLQDLFVAEDKPILRYGGTIREIKDKISEKKIVCRSYGQALNEIDANYELEINRSARHILRRIISVYTDLLFIDNSTLDDVVIDSFVISGKLVEIIETLTTIGGFAWTTNARGEFVILDYVGDHTSKSFVNGEGVIITKYEDDDTTVKNEVRLVGARKTFRNVEEHEVGSSADKNNTYVISTNRGGCSICRYEAVSRRSIFYLQYRKQYNT